MAESGSEAAPNARAAFAGFNTLLSAAMGGLSWVFFDFIFTRKLSGLSLCTGIVAGLVGITAGAGFVAPWAALVIGLVVGFITNIFCRLKLVFGYDDTLDAFGLHGVGGFFGLFFTGIFATGYITNSGGANLPGKKKKTFNNRFFYFGLVFGLVFGFWLLFRLVLFCFFVWLLLSLLLKSFLFVLFYFLSCFVVICF